MVYQFTTGANIILMKNNILLTIFIFSVFGCISKTDYMNQKKTQPILFEIVELEEKENMSFMQLLIKLPLNKLVFNKINNSFISNVTIDLYILDDNDNSSERFLLSSIFNDINKFL